MSDYLNSAAFVLQWSQFVAPPTSQCEWSFPDRGYVSEPMPMVIGGEVHILPMTSFAIIDIGEIASTAVRLGLWVALGMVGSGDYMTIAVRMMCRIFLWDHSKHAWSEQGVPQLSSSNFPPPMLIGPKTCFGSATKPTRNTTPNTGPFHWRFVDVGTVTATALE